MKPGEIAPTNLMLVHRIPDEDDDVEPFKPLEWGLIRRLFAYARPVRTKVRLLACMTVIRSAQLPALVFITSIVIAGPIARGEMRGTLIGAAAFLALGVFTDGMFHFRQRFALEIGETVVNGVRSDIFAKMQGQPMGFFHKIKLGRIISRMTSDIEAVRVGIQDVAFVSAIQFGQMVFAALAMAFWDFELFLIVVAMAPILWQVNRHFRMKLSRLSRLSQDSFSRVTATLAESVNGIRVTQGFVRQETNAGLFRSLLADHSRYNIALARTSAILSPLLDLNSQFFIAILLLFGGWRVFHGGMHVGSLIEFTLMANQFFSPITIIGNQYNQGMLAMASAERIFWLVDYPPEWVEDPGVGELPDPRGGSIAGGPAAGALIARRPGSRGARVEFKSVFFGYNPERLVLHDIAFEAEPGLSVALVGHTGSGKSSIVNLTAKFYLATRGQVLIDGRDLRGVSGLSVHRQLGMVQQQNFLFSGTVLDNIRLSRPEASDEEVRAAARRLDCLDILDALPRGLMTEVGERGAGLSVGQRQLICFCRALLAEPRIVILDEATSSIDAITEHRLQRALLALLEGRTSLIVAHRLSTIRHAGLVLVLDQGRIVERGTHARLLAAGGHYAGLYKQFVQMDES